MSAVVIILIALAIVCIRLLMGVVQVLVRLLVWIIGIAPGLWRTLRWRMTLHGFRSRN